MGMNRVIFFTAALLILSAAGSLKAQVQDTIKRDTVIVIPPLADSSLVGKSIFELIGTKSAAGAQSAIKQSENIRSAFQRHIEASAKRKIQGYRVRIYFDNSQQARIISGEIAAKFKFMYPLIPVYWTHISPNFKVTVGDFRTKSEAMKLLREIESTFNSAFLVKEVINYPPI